MKELYLEIWNENRDEYATELGSICQELDLTTLNYKVAIFINMSSTMFTNKTIIASIACAVLNPSNVYVLDDPPFKLNLMNKNLFEQISVICNYCCPAPKLVDLTEWMNESVLVVTDSNKTEYKNAKTLSVLTVGAGNSWSIQLSTIKNQNSHVTNIFNNSDEYFVENQLSIMYRVLATFFLLIIVAGYTALLTTFFI
jgi:hypothetical protein